MKYFSLWFLPWLLLSTVNAQIKPIGNWRDHLSMQNIIYIDTIKQNIIAASPNGYFIFNPLINEISTQSKSTGLSDVHLSVFSKQPDGNRIVIGYENGNVDVVGSNSIRNVPEILLSKIVSNKKIFSACWNDQLAYIATNFGIVVLDPFKFEIRDAYFLGKNGALIEVYQLAFTSDKIYASTSEGIKSAFLNTGKLNDFRSWFQENISSSSTNVQALLKWGESLIAQTGDSLFINEGGAWKFFYKSASPLMKINTSRKNLYINETNSITTFASPLAIPQVIKSNLISQANYAFVNGNTLWIGDATNGLVHITDNQANIIVPNAPGGIAYGQAASKEGTILVVAGSQQSLTNTNKQNKWYVFKEDRWTTYDSSTFKPLTGLADCIAAALEPSTGTIFIGTNGTGLLSIDPANKIEKFGIWAGGLQSNREQQGMVQVAGLAVDLFSNVWMTNPNTNAPVVVKKKDGTWKNFSIPLPIQKNLINKVLIDRRNKKWFTTMNAGGLIFFDDNNTIDITSDDQWRLFQQGTGRGNLPSSNVLSVAEDQSGNIWVGTENGMGIIQCGSNMLQNCDATLPVVQQDNFAGLLLANERVNDIKVDAADRKWIASNNGVWLLSSDGQKVIYRFTAANSKLLDDRVHEIAINGLNGEVFFMTSSGISSFRSTATDALEQIKKPIVFPNPVPSGYNGIIGIKDLPNNAWVKIMELDGRLVHQTRALGGQAIWNGKNYKGERVNSGVYLIMIATEDNTEHIVGKIVFIK